MSTRPTCRQRRDAGGDYAFELTEAEHVDLLAFLRGLNGKVVLSGYPHPLYDEALADWRAWSAGRWPMARDRAPKCCG